MYFPYFRGKQYELVVVRENAELLSRSGFVPIIEPVKENFKPLERALREIEKSHGRAIVIANPKCGDLAKSSELVVKFIDKTFAGSPSITIGVLLSAEDTPDSAIALIEKFSERQVSIVHSRFFGMKEFLVRLGATKIQDSVFVGYAATDLSLRGFQKGQRILVQDGFERRANKLYANAAIEKFSDLHILPSQEYRLHFLLRRMTERALDFP